MTKAFLPSAFSSDAFSATEDAAGHALAFEGSAFFLQGFSSTQDPATAGLVFSQESSPSTDLVFGLEEAPTENVSSLSWSIEVSPPAPSGTIRAGFGIDAAIDCGDPAPTATVTYVSDTARPTVSQHRNRFQDALPENGYAESSWQDTLALPAYREAVYQDASPLPAEAHMTYREALRLHPAKSVRFQEASPAPVGFRSRFQQALPTRRGAQSRYQEGLKVSRGLWSRYQEATRIRRGQTAPYQDGVPVRAYVSTPFGQGRPLPRAFSNRYQGGMQPLPGTSFPPVTPPEVDKCYTPNTALLFQTAFVAGSSELLFYCENHGEGPGPEPGTDTIVVPVRKVYMQLNEVLLRVISTNQIIEAPQATLDLDSNSWTWGFRATVPIKYLDSLLPSGNDPVAVELKINGVSYHMLVESLTRDRQFGSRTLSLQGRGLNAVLADPYAPTKNFGNTGLTTAEQLMNNVLTLNGVGIGWDVDFGLDDWSIPAGAFSHQGTYLTALQSIAQAAGGYLQPSPSAQNVRVLPLYPAASWNWGDITPDYELPSAVMAQESIEWVRSPEYNSVYVSGVSQGVLAFVRKTGSDGLAVAPMVTDPLITAAAAARQRGISILSPAGKSLRVTLRMPVLEETGIILPGKFVRYVDGSTERMGIVRGVNVTTGVKVRQSLTIESFDL